MQKYYLKATSVQNVGDTPLMKKKVKRTSNQINSSECF